MPTYVAYYRVSTAKQGRSGLGLEAQQAAVRAHIGGGELTAELTEIESGRKNDRPQLACALRMCRLTGATLIIAKLDRLARNAKFLLSVVEGSGEAGVVFCDLPTVPAGPVGKFLVTQMAAVAELEAGLISQRTREALTAAKARGKELGGWRGGPGVDGRLGTMAIQAAADAFAAEIGPVVRPLRESGMSLNAIAAELTRRRFLTPRRKTWTAAAVRNVLARAA